MKNAVRSFEVGAISDSSVSRHPAEMEDRIHYTTCLIIHYKLGFPISPSFNVSANYCFAVSTEWPPS